jgi:hypothetical protein
MESKSVKDDNIGIGLMLQDMRVNIKIILEHFHIFEILKLLYTYMCLETIIS